jgi:YVTN family beta-propeller protein
VTGRWRGSAGTLAAALVLGAPAACTLSAEDGAAGRPASGSLPDSATASPTTPTRTPATQPGRLPAPGGVYAHAAAGLITGAARRARPLVYVPESLGNRVTVIDPLTFRVVRRFAVGREPQHVVPSWDLRTLWVNDDLGNDLVPIDPVTGRPGARVPVVDPYNLYFTPDGRHALVMAERLRRIDVRDPHSMRLQRSLRVPCRGVNHADFTADGSVMLASCEFSGRLVVVPTTFRAVASVLDLNGRRTGARQDAMASGPRALLAHGASAMPQDVRLTSNGRSFVVADMLRGGVWVVDAAHFRVSAFVRTGAGAHGIYPSRDGRALYVSNRDAGTISVLDATGRRVLAVWTLPRGSSPDMGGVSADGTKLWLSGRYDSEVYVVSTRSGRLLRRIRVGPGPHGLAVWPQPGRHSLGHTGTMR